MLDPIPFIMSVTYGIAVTRPSFLGLDEQNMWRRRISAPPHAFCQSCGAPTEPLECSYCKTPSGYIVIDNQLFEG